MDEGRIVAWHKREGDVVAAGDVLFEVETDKATMEVESPTAGTRADHVRDVDAEFLRTLARGRRGANSITINSITILDGCKRLRLRGTPRAGGTPSRPRLGVGA